MVTLNKKVLAAMFVVLLALAVMSCKKKSEGGLIDLQSETDNSLMEDENTSIFNFVDFTGENDAGTNGPTPPGTPPVDHILPLCARFKVDTIPPADSTNGYWPRRLYIWFDNDLDTTEYGDCTCNDGIVRRGKIIIIFFGKHMTPGLKFKIQLWKYYAKGNLHEGDREFEWVDDSTVHISASGIKIKFTDGRTASFSFDKYIRRVTCPVGINDTTTYLDDAYEFWGTVDGYNRKGKHYTISTISNVVRSSRECCDKMTLVSGIVEITTDGTSMRTIDFGDGTCDTQAVVTIDGQQYFVKWR